MLYQIHRYPADLIDVVRLAGGQRVVIRPVLPQDADLTEAFFRNLSGASRYDRFMTPHARPAARPPAALHARSTTPTTGARGRGVRATAARP